MAYGKLALAGEQIQDLLAIIDDESFAIGEPEIVEDFDMIQRHMAAIQGQVTMARRMKVVLDAGNGLSGAYLPPVLTALGLDVECLYCEPDGTFPNHLPNPEDPEMTPRPRSQSPLSWAPISGSLLMATATAAASSTITGIISRLTGCWRSWRATCSAGIPARLWFSMSKPRRRLPDEIRKYGGEPVMWKSGHSLMKQKMNEIGSLLGGEVSGHLFIGEDYYGFDDAPLVALKTLEIISKSDSTIAEIFDEIPKLVATPEIVLSAPDDLKFKMIDEMTASLQNAYEVVTVDGARVNFSDGWGLVRASNTQPAVTLRFEAYTREQIAHYMRIFEALLDRYPQINQERFDELLVEFSA